MHSAQCILNLEIVWSTAINSWLLCRHFQETHLRCRSLSVVETYLTQLVDYQHSIDRIQITSIYLVGTCSIKIALQRSSCHRIKSSCICSKKPNKPNQHWPKKLTPTNLCVISLFPLFKPKTNHNGNIPRKTVTLHNFCKNWFRFWFKSLYAKCLSYWVEWNAAKHLLPKSRCGIISISMKFKNIFCAFPSFIELLFFFLQFLRRIFFEPN